MKFILYIGKFLFALVLAPTLIILFNNMTDNSVVKFIVYAQNSPLYNSYFIYMNPCDPKHHDRVENNVLYMDEFNFSDSLGSCYKNGLKNIDKVVIDTNFGGRTTSALIMAKEIKKNKIDVQIINECYSSCVDVLMHGNKRLVCENAIVGVHQLSSDYEYDFLNKYLIRNIEVGITRYNNESINVPLLLSLIKKTSSDDMYKLSHEELIQTGVATKIVACDF